MFRMRWRHDFRELRTLEDLDEVLAASETSPVFLYKHSLTCGTSAVALEEMAQLAAADPGVPIHLVPVQTSREVSDAVESRLGVRHESPQLILVESGAARWHTSHFGVTAERALQVLAQAGRTAS